MARYDSYPTGTAVGTDQVLYLADPAGTPAIKRAPVSDFTANPWGLLASPGGAVVGDEFDGTDPLTWIDLLPASGGGHATWTVGLGVQSVSFGGQSANVFAYRLVAHALAIGESVEMAVSFAGSRFIATVGLIVTDGVTEASHGVYGGAYIDTGALQYNLLRSGTLASMAGAGADINDFRGLTAFGGRPTRYRFTRVDATTLAYALSLDGVSWTSLGITALTWLRTPSHVGLAVSSWGSDTTGYGDLVAAFDYLRVTTDS